VGGTSATSSALCGRRMLNELARISALHRHRARGFSASGEGERQGTRRGAGAQQRGGRSVIRAGKSAPGSML